MDLNPGLALEIVCFKFPATRILSFSASFKAPGHYFFKLKFGQLGLGAFHPNWWPGALELAKKDKILRVGNSKWTIATAMPEFYKFYE